MNEEWVKAFPVPFPEEYKKTHPNAVKYCMRHGIYKMISEKWPPNLGSYKNTEEVYAACLESMCTWEELLGHKEDENVIQ